MTFFVLSAAGDDTQFKLAIVPEKQAVNQLGFRKNPMWKFVLLIVTWMEGEPLWEMISWLSCSTINCVPKI